MYKVIEGFYDLQDKTKDGYHEYVKGDTYPREGVTLTQERIAELSGPDNARKAPLIEEVLVAPVPEIVEAPPARKRTRKK